MGTLRGIAIGCALAALSLSAAAGASAATEVGNECRSTVEAEDFTMVQFEKAPGGLPLSVPSAGIVTRWKVNAGPLPHPMLERLRVFRPAGGGANFETVAESSFELVEPERLNSFETRISVIFGDRFGAYAKAPFGTLICQTGNSADQMGSKKIDAGVGTTQTYSPASGYQVAVSAVIERDADNDGYGDETQDRCPTTPSLQTECPPAPKLGVFSQAGKNTAKIYVATNTPAPVVVFGTVDLPAPAGKARASARVKLRAPTKTVSPGEIVAFKLKFTGLLKGALAATPKGRSLKLEVTATASNATGVPASKDLVVKLKGR